MAHTTSQASQSLPRISLEGQPEEVFRIQLTVDEVAVIMRKLSKGFSLHIDSRFKKEAKATRRKQEVAALEAEQAKMHSKTKAVSAPTVLAAKKVAPVINEAVKPCQKILASLMSSKNSWPFLEPVQVEALGIPEYNQIVKEPMDLSTVSEKLQSGVYETTQQFHADIMKIINNSYLFNGVNEDFLRITSDFEKYYYRISGETKPADKVNPKAPQVLPSKSQKKRKRNQPNSRDNNELQPITTEDKKELAAMIHRLAKEHMKGIRSIVFEGASDQVEVDLELLPQKKLRELLKYVRGRIYEMESSIRSTLQEKCEGRELDEQYSDKTDSFIDESYWECKQEPEQQR